MLANRDSTYAITSNARTTIDLNELFRPVGEEIRRRLSRLDGDKFFSELLWKLPDRQLEWLGDLNFETDATEYLQAAGTADRMTVELRVASGTKPGQFVVGRTLKHSESLTARVSWNGSEVSVGPGEVFTADEAAALFDYYYDHHEVPSDYQLRQIELPG